MKLRTFEQQNYDNPEFNDRKFKHYWKNLCDYYRNTGTKKEQLDLDQSLKRKANVMLSPSRVFEFDTKIKGSAIEGLRNIVPIKRSQPRFIPLSNSEPPDMKFGVPYVHFKYLKIFFNNYKLSKMVYLKRESKVFKYEVSVLSIGDFTK